MPATCRMTCTICSWSTRAAGCAARCRSAACCAADGRCRSSTSSIPISRPRRRRPIRPRWRTCSATRTWCPVRWSAATGGNAGARTVTVAVRALAVGELTATNALRFVAKEVAVGGLNGIIFAIMMGGAVVLWYCDWRLGAVIDAAMICNLLAAALAGTLIPLGFQKNGSRSGGFLDGVPDDRDRRDRLPRVPRARDTLPPLADRPNR